MRRLILQEFISVDGLAAGPDHSVDFVPKATQGDRRFGAEQLAVLKGVDTILLGRVTYQLFAGYWPNVTTGEERTFADRLNATPKIVFSKRLERAPWGRWPEATIVGNSPADEVARLKRQDGKDMVVWGSISVAQALMEARLIDEYRLVVCPAVLGTGTALFRDRVRPHDLTLVVAKTFDRGAAVLVYTPTSTP